MKNNFYNSELYDVFEGMTAISSVISSIENFGSSRKIQQVLFNETKKKSKYNEIKFLEIQSAAHINEMFIFPVQSLTDLYSKSICILNLGFYLMYMPRKSRCFRPHAEKLTLKLCVLSHNFYGWLS